MKNVWCVPQISRLFTSPAKGAGPSSAALRFVPPAFLLSSLLPTPITLPWTAAMACPLHKPPACFQGNGLKPRSSHLPCLLLATVQCLVLSSVHTSLGPRLHATPLPLPAFPRSTLVVALQKHKGPVTNIIVYSIPFPSSVLAVPACLHPATLLRFDAKSAQGLSQSIQPCNMKHRDMY